MASANIHDYIAPGRRAHLVGIGGVSMSPLAEVLHKAGMVITGSDMRNSATVEHLRALGIPVAIGHRGENVQGAELVIRTAAVHDENPEIAAARAAGIPVFERAQAWGAIMRGYKNALCIAGTHGKTTTTSMCTHIIMAARAGPHRHDRRHPAPAGRGPSGGPRGHHHPGELRVLQLLPLLLTPPWRSF